ncbi:cinnamoyl- reductase protein [Rutstroemia sp. NJR-2017a WRK4]|nr:cinnamoyl- reductase protein [Rutstroemia sp. NJR-2017a WRK4]
MTPPTLLITGATGFIGFRTLLEALEAGYTVRATIRSSSSPRSQTLLAHPLLSSFISQNKLSFIEAPDILAPDAYTSTLKDITYAIHLASPLPLPFKNPQTEIINPTIQGTLNLLRAALHTPSLRRIIITSSIVANLPFPHPTSNPPLTEAETRVPDPQDLDTITSVFPAYCAAKIATLNATDAFVSTHNPAFDVVRIFPGFVYGRDSRATDIPSLMTGSNRLLLSTILGQAFPEPQLAGAAHVLDVARVHVLALNSSLARTQDFGVTIPVVYDDAFQIVKKHFPKEVEEGIFKQGSQPSLRIEWKAEKTEEVLGFRFRGFEDMVVDVAGQYLEFLGKVG